MHYAKWSLKKSAVYLTTPPGFVLRQCCLCSSSAVCHGYSSAVSCAVYVYYMAQTQLFISKALEFWYVYDWLIGPFEEAL